MREILAILFLFINFSLSFEGCERKREDRLEPDFQGRS